MLHLIADSGIQFYSSEAEFDPAQQLALPSGRPLKYSFCNIKNPTTGERFFDLLSYNSSIGKFIPVNEIVENNAMQLLADGRSKLDECGVEMMRPDVSPTFYNQIEPGDPERLMTFNSPASYKTPNPANVHEKVPAFDLVLGRWLPMPMFEMHSGVSGDVPYGWCRLRIDKIGEGAVAGTQRYRFTWAFDTQITNDDLAIFRPVFTEGMEKMEYALCNQVSNLLTFMSPNGDFTVFSHYISELLGLDSASNSYRYVGWYIYLINFIRFMGVAPEVTLHYCPPDREIPVDLVLDIGNSRTCGLLFENGDFTKATMLSLRDMSDPAKTDDKPFDMRLVFRQADFGNDIVIEDEQMFRYPSMVRVGSEAKKLVYRSAEDDGLWTSTTNYSSPKRYLWDNKQFKEKWEFLTIDTDPLYIREAQNIYIPDLSDQFDANGDLIRDWDSIAEFVDGHTHYSRSSLMTFVMIEILNQALMQINSPEFRKHGDINCKRTLRNLILTCPTAMPKVEQVKLRRCAVDAFEALKNVMPESMFPSVEVFPSVEKLEASPEDAFDEKDTTWTYDEATCSQLVYLYAEIAERYKGRAREFFELKGHVRPELAEEGYKDKAMTVASVDIGAGTTDVMVCTYKCDPDDISTLTPRPIFWDSFYVAGDDILRNIIQNVIIEDGNADDPEVGSIYSALLARLNKMSIDEIAALPVMKRHSFYRSLLSDLRSAAENDKETADIKHKLASGLIRNFFGVDSTMMDDRDRRCRVDFNTQISHPMSQFFMEMLRLHRPSRLYSFDEIFSEIKPSQYLLDYFAAHFGFRFEELKWRFKPEQIADIVKSTLEKLMQQISVMLYAHHCDIIVLSGRPTSIDAVTELFVKYLSVTPDRLVRLNEYRVGQWYPLADPEGYFRDQKAVVAVGAMVGYLASTEGFNGMAIRFDDMVKHFHSTDNYICLYHGERMDETMLTPTHNSETVNLSIFPAFFGAKQFNHPLYEGRPVYALYNNSGNRTLRVTISRDFQSEPEKLILEDVSDANGDQVPLDSIDFMGQSILSDGKHWLDKGEFELSVTRNH